MAFTSIKQLAPSSGALATIHFPEGAHFMWVELLSHVFLTTKRVWTLD